MKKQILTIVFLLYLSISFSQKILYIYDSNGNRSGHKIMNVKPILEIYPSEFEFSSASKIDSFQIINGGLQKLDWKISQFPSWVKIISNQTGSNNGIVKFMVEDNNDLFDRNADIKIESNDIDKDIHVIHVNQKRRNLYALVFEVMFNGSYVNDAIVRVDNIHLKTDFNGKSTFFLQSGIYNYEIVKNGFKELSNVLSVNAKDSNLIIQLSREHISSIKTLCNMEINLYPNPVKSNLNIDVKNYQGLVSYTIMNSAGMLIAKKDEYLDNSGSLLIDFQNIKTGLHFIQLRLNDKVLNYKIIKE